MLTQWFKDNENMVPIHSGVLCICKIEKNNEMTKFAGKWVDLDHIIWSAIT